MLSLGVALTADLRAFFFSLLLTGRALVEAAEDFFCCSSLFWANPVGTASAALEMSGFLAISALFSVRPVGMALARLATLDSSLFSADFVGAALFTSFKAEVAVPAWVNVSMQGCRLLGM